MSLKKPLEDVIQRLKAVGGRPDFENAVADAFGFLDLQVEIIPDTQAESDLIVKAPLPQNPYFVIIECSAVRVGEFVGYQKLGQIRGNAPKYFRQYGKELPSYYKMIVGRPAFSEDAKQHASGDVVLLTVDSLITILESHSLFQFSQDELRLIFETKGEVNVDRIKELNNPYLKNLRTYGLVFMGLLEEPTSNPDKRKKEWVHIHNLVGSAATLGWFLEVNDVTQADIVRAVGELCSPLRRIMEISQDERLRLTSIPFEVVIEKMGRQGVVFNELLTIFQSRLKLKKATEEKNPRSGTLSVDVSSEQ